MDGISKHDFPKKILIAHQSTIPHYRVPFYEAVERLRPSWWQFTVLYDPQVSRQDRFVPVNPETVNFTILVTRTWYLPFSKKKLHLQSFLLAARKYDLIVVEDLLKNITYPLLHFYRLLGKFLLLWGHGRDLSVVEPKGIKRFYEAIKMRLARSANGYFAYTPGVKEGLIEKGLNEGSVFVLNNTIDIRAQRRVYRRLINHREELRIAQDLASAKVLLYVGRLDKSKHLDVLVETFAILKAEDLAYHLIVVGGGDMSPIWAIQEHFGPNAITHYDLTTDLEILGPLYVMSDAYIFPGDVGLGPLQALCYDLTPVVIDSPTHKPEYEYLNDSNAFISPEGTEPHEYARAIERLLSDKDRLQTLRAQSWPSIQHLTIESMAENFVRGINAILRHG